MKLPRDLHGDELIRALCREWEYKVVHQEGSHVVLQTETPGHHRIAVPRHRRLRVGTLAAIVRSVALHKAVTRDRMVKSLSRRFQKVNLETRCVIGPQLRGDLPVARLPWHWFSETWTSPPWPATC